MTDETEPRPATRKADPDASTPPPTHAPQPRQPVANNGFDANQPTIITLCFLGGWVTGGLSGLIGGILAHIWQGENTEEWAASHYTYNIRTFWITVAATAILFVSLIGWLLLWVPAVYITVRAIMSLLKAQKREPMPDPTTFLF